MAKKTVAFTLKSALERKAAQRKDYASLSVSKKVELLDKLFINAAFLKSLRPKVKVTSK
jgi:hypothetical protein